LISVDSAGIVGLPFALQQSGFISGMILLIVLGGVTDWTIRLIVLNAKLAGQPTYIDIMQAAFGTTGRAACSFFQFTFAFGGMCAFCIILGDTLPSVLIALVPTSWAETGFISFLLSRQVVIIFFTLSISYPLSLYRDIEKLSRASGLALVRLAREIDTDDGLICLCSMFVILMVVAIRGPALEPEYKGPSSDMWTFFEPGIPSAIGVISFAYVCHHNSRSFDAKL
jgi:sodium-coupled neutral amino acid transporter 11